MDYKNDAMVLPERQVAYLLLICQAQVRVSSSYG